MRDLNVELPQAYGIDLTGWLLLQATGISDDRSTIVGWGLNPAGNTEAWVAVIPEPSSTSIALLAALGLFFRLNRV